MLLLIATFKVAQENQAEFEAIFTDLIAAVRAREPDVTFYQLGKVQGEDMTYRMLEQYASEDTFKGHMATEWFQAAFPKFGALLTEPPVLEKLTPVG